MWATKSSGSRRAVNRKRPGSVKRRAACHQLDVNARPRKRQRPRHRNSGRWIQFSAITLTLLSLCAGGRWLYLQSVVENTEFTLQNLVIFTDGGLSPEHLTDVAAVQAGANMLSLDLEKIRQTLEALPLVESATVERVFPSDLEIRVTERRPVAWLACGAKGVEPFSADHGLLVSDDGLILSCDVMLARFEHLPVVTVEAIPEPGRSGATGHRNLRMALELLEKHQSKFSGLSESTTKCLEIVEIQLLHAYSLTCIYDQDLQVTFALSDFDRQLQDLEWILSEATAAGRRLATVNTMMSRNIPVTFHDTGLPTDPAQPGGGATPHLRPLGGQSAADEAGGVANENPDIRQILRRG